MSAGEAPPPNDRDQGEAAGRPADSVFDASGVAHATESVARSAEAEEVAQRLDFATSEATAADRFREWEHADPFPSIPPSLLNSADIADYVAATGLIHPFYPEALKSASYAVRFLGDVLYWDENDRRVEETIRKGDRFVLRQNSIAFVTLEPMFRFPDYIAARFNLRIPNVYKGLLLGTGPLVDPGWTGVLSIPLHNLTTQNYLFLGGEELIWMEFTKLSPNSKWASRQQDATTRQGLHVPFPPSRRGGDVQTRVALASPNSPVTSSLARVASQVQKTAAQAEKAAGDARKAREGAERIRSLFTLAGGIALLVALLTVSALAVQVWALRKDINDLKGRDTPSTTSSVPTTKTVPPVAPSTTTRPRR